MRYIMKKILLLIPLLFLTGCLSLDGIVSTAASTTGAVIGTVVAGPAVGAVLGIGTGIGADVITPSPAPQIEEINNIWQLLAYAWQSFTTHIIAFSAIGFVLWFLTGYVGMRMKRPEEKAMENIIINKLQDK